MKLVTYLYKEQENVGVMHTDGTRIAPVRELGLPYDTMNDLIVNLTDEQRKTIQMAEEVLYTLRTDEITLLSPIPHPLQDVICLGLNYTEHAKEAAFYSKDAFTKKDARHPIYFSKRVNTSPGPDAVIPAYEDLVDRLDYETELAVILGRDVFRISREEVKDCIFGYTVLNDVSARNLQTAHSQWYFGKSLDGFTPMGPVITTAEEIAFPPRLAIRGSVNGELRQNSTTDMLLTGIDSIIEELSRGMTLKAGTIIATGTPKGVGMGFDPPRWLKKGDVVECEIEKIGVLRNRIG